MSSISSHLISLITDFDCSSSIVGITYHGRRRYKSFLGGVLTVQSMISITVITIIYLVKYFGKQDKQIVYQDEKFSEPPLLDLSQNFHIAVMMQFSGANFFREDIIKIEAVYIRKENSTYQEKPIELFDCGYKNFPTNATMFDFLGLKKAKCLNLSGIDIQGGSINRIYHYVQIKFVLCDEGEIYEAFFEQAKPLVLIYFLDTMYDIHSSRPHVEKYINYVDVNVTYRNAKMTNVFFSRNNINEQADRMIRSDCDFANFVIDSYRDYESVRTEHQKNLLLINLLSSKKKQIIHISYLTMMDVFANIGSFMNIIIVVFSMIGNYVNHYSFQGDLIKVFFEEEKKINAMLSKANKVAPLVHNTNAKTVTINRNSLFATNVRENKSLVLFSKKHIFYIGLCDIVSMITCGYSPRTKLKVEYRRTLKYINAYQDLLNLYKKIKEIEIFQRLLLKNQKIHHQNKEEEIYSNNNDSNKFLLTNCSNGISKNEIFPLS